MRGFWTRFAVLSIIIGLASGLVTGSDRSELAVQDLARAYVESPSRVRAQAFVAAARADGDPRWVPWLVDLLRLGGSTSVESAARAALAEMTGIESRSRIPDLIAYGSWFVDRGVDGGPGYREFKVALYSRADSAFGPLLESIPDPVELAAIQWGGVAFGGIPELNDPLRVPGAEADWMTDDELVLSLEVDGEAVAYPLRILARHELVNDTVGDLPLAVVYCTLCRSAVVYSRQVPDGPEVRWLTSGLLINSNKIMVDVETETLWSHLRGIGIGGRHAGVELDRLPVRHVRWADWIGEHPDAEVPALPEPIFFDDPERPPIAYDYTPGAAYASYYEADGVWFPVITAPDRWPPKTEVIGIAHRGEAHALGLDDLIAGRSPVTVEVGGEQFTVIPGTVDATVVDSAGDPVLAERSFWFAWYATHPTTSF